MQNKGISPLIQVIILIGLVVSIVGIIFTWGEDLVERTSKSSESEFIPLLELTNIRLTLTEAKITNFESNPLAAPPPQTVTFKIRNDSDQTIESFIIYLVASNEDKVLLNNEYVVNIFPLEEKEFSLTFDDIPDRDHFELIPRINGKAMNYKIKFTPIVI